MSVRRGRAEDESGVASALGRAFADDPLFDWLIPDPTKRHRMLPAWFTLGISRQNSRSTSRRSDGAPGDFISDRPLSSFIHPAGLPINTSTIKVLQPPVESAQYTSWAFGRRLRAAGVLGSMGSIGDAYDNSMAESFFSTLRVPRSRLSPVSLGFWSVPVRSTRAPRSRSGSSGSVADRLAVRLW